MANKPWQTALKAALKGGTDQPLANQAAYTAAAAGLFAPVLTDEVSGQIDWSDPADPVLKQFLPVAEELHEDPDSSADPVGDQAASQAPGVIHKYRGRVLLIASGSCAVNCRYCFRRHFDYRQQFAPRNNWHAAISYLTGRSDVHEVILSGGDPLTLQDETLNGLTEQLAKLPHIKTLRIHSRIPVVLPQRIDAGFIKWSQSVNLNKVMVLHINHPNEISPAASTAIEQLHQAGFVLLNQSVLLKGVNDQAGILADLSHQLFKHHILPYYLHQFDAVQNAGHFAVADEQALQIHQQLRDLLPGYLLPTLVREVAGEAAKTPLVR